MLGQRLKSGVIEKMGWSILLPLYTVVNIQWEKYGPFTCFKRDVFAIKILVHTTTLEKWSRLLHNNRIIYSFFRFSSCFEFSTQLNLVLSPNSKTRDRITRLTKGEGGRAKVDICLRGEGVPFCQIDVDLCMLS